MFSTPASTSIAAPGGGDAREADDAGRRGAAHRVEDHPRHARALDDDVGPQPRLRQRVGVIDGAQVAHELRLGAVGDHVQHVRLEPALDGEQRGQQADRAGAGDHGAARPRAQAAEHGVDLVPGLGDDARRLEQHADAVERRVESHDVLGFDPPALGAEPVERLDAALGVAAVAAHVEAPGGAALARFRVGAADDPDDQIAGRDGGAVRPLQHAAERLVAEDEPVPPSGAQPYSPAAISRSVPQMPSARARTSTAPPSGSGTSSTRRDPARPGSTVSARIARSVRRVSCTPPHVDVLPALGTFRRSARRLALSVRRKVPPRSALFPGRLHPVAGLGVDPGGRHGRRRAWQRASV